LNASTRCFLIGALLLAYLITKNFAKSPACGPSVSVDTPRDRDFTKISF